MTDIEDRDAEERNLRTALRPHRPDPDAFRRQFDRKLAERTAQAEDGTDVRASGWRAAAAVLPLGVFDPHATTTTALLGKPAGAKSLAALFALPAVSLAMVALTLLGSLRALVGLKTNATVDRDHAQRATQAWWTQHRGRALVTLAALAVVGWTQPVEAVLGVLLVSMAVVASMLVFLSRAGAASRASIGEFTSGLLGALAAVTLLIGKVGMKGWTDPWVPFALLAGCFGCDILGGWRTRASARARALSIVLPLIAMGWAAQRMHANLRTIDRERLVAFVEEFDEPLADVVAWNRLGIVTTWLRANEDLQLDLAEPRAIVERHFATRPRGTGGASVAGPGATTHALLGAARAGLFPERGWAEIRGDAQSQAVLTYDGRLLESGTTEWLVRAAVREPQDDAWRDRIAARLEAAWPRADAVRALEAMAFYDEMLNLIGRPNAGEPLRISARDALVSHWTGTANEAADVAPFASDPSRLGDDQADILRVGPTLAAVRLMRRFGVPAAVDLDAVERFLRQAATPSWIESIAPRRLEPIFVQSYRYVAEIGLRELLALRGEQGLPAPTIGLGRTLFDRRLLLGALALVGLCVFATWRAAVAERAAVRG